MKLAAPQVDRACLCPVGDIAVTEDPLEGYWFESVPVEDEDLDRLEVRGCVFSHCVWQQLPLRKSGFVDVIFDRCDFSGCDFSGAVFSRVRFESCKLTGVNFGETVFRDVAFTDCRAPYLNLAAAKAQRLLFQACRLNDATFQELKWQAAFQRCDLTGATFHFAPLKGINLTTNQLAGLRVGLPDLKGAVVNTFQAAELSRLLGLVINDTPQEDD